MQDPQKFYAQQLKRYKEQAQQLKRQSLRLSVLRVLVFLVTAVLIYFFYHHTLAATLTGICGVILFVCLLSIHENLRQKRQLTQRLVLLNIEEQNIARGDYTHRPQGNLFLEAGHSYAHDIDLFGKGSFFQYLNRTGLREGTAALAALLNSNNLDGIADKQRALAELAQIPEWMQRYTAIAQGLKTDEEASKVLHWITHYKRFLKPVIRFLCMGFGLSSVLILGLTVLQLIPPSILGYWILFGLGITSLYLKRVNALAVKSSKAKEFFRQYTLLLDAIENQPFKANLLRQWQMQIRSEGDKASAIFKKFSKALDALDHRNNLIAAVLGNGLFLWDLVQSYRIEAWLGHYGDKAEDWFKVVSTFDAYNSLGTFAFNHQDFNYPQLVDHEILIKAEGLGHPLIAPEKRICSDLYINETNFFIVTGANMAGKSTFLRAVALHIIMANLGLPVCAQKSSYKPIKLISSMRTSDSLAEESSYFFSELTRLKFIVDQLQNDRYFVILDEILKGTNSTDKAIGSKQFVKRLVSLKACGIIATHDLSLTAIDEEEQGVKNYFFDAQIKDDELYFDYKLKAGVCQNMNASFLLRKMGIVE